MSDFLWKTNDMVHDHRVIDGKDACIVVDGRVEHYADEFEWNIENDKKGFHVIGSEWEYEKDSIKKGTFKLSVYKTNSAMLEIGFKPFEIIHSVNAEKYGCEKLRLKNCKLKKLGSSTKAGELIKEEWEGSFTGLDRLDLIKE